MSTNRCAYTILTTEPMPIQFTASALDALGREIH